MAAAISHVNPKPACSDQGRRMAVLCPFQPAAPKEPERNGGSVAVGPICWTQAKKVFLILKNCVDRCYFADPAVLLLQAASPNP